VEYDDDDDDDDVVVVVDDDDDEEEEEFIGEADADAVVADDATAPLSRLMKFV
jgi:hypothetical protein